MGSHILFLLSGKEKDLIKQLAKQMVPLDAATGTVLAFVIVSAEVRLSVEILTAKSGLTRCLEEIGGSRYGVCGMWRTRPRRSYIVGDQTTVSRPRSALNPLPRHATVNAV